MCGEYDRPLCREHSEQWEEQYKMNVGKRPETL